MNLERTGEAQRGHDAAVGGSPHFHSQDGTASFDTCFTEWFCHLAAWGNPRNWTRCQVRDCGGKVTWSPE